MSDRQSSQGIAVGEPAPPSLLITDFQNMARQASCAENLNRLYIIDGRQVLWTHAGNCADASYEQVLFGARPDTRLCSHGDTIAGPRTTCADAQSRTLFDTMVSNLDKGDLGLGGGHKVEAVAVSGTDLPFKTLSQTSFSNVHEPRNVVVKDADAWRRLWQEHAPDAPIPAVDFNTSMVVGVFMGNTSPCYSTVIANINRGADRIAVLRVDRYPPPDVACVTLVTWPAHLVVVERSALRVDFVTEVVQRN